MNKPWKISAALALGVSMAGGSAAVVVVVVGCGSEGDAAELEQPEAGAQDSSVTNPTGPDDAADGAADGLGGSGRATPARASSTRSGTVV